MKTLKLLAILTAASFISSPSIAQTSEQYRACLNTCYQHYLAGMNTCHWASNPATCYEATERAYSECRLECAP
jgi:hypothetical protein